ncbi:MAG: P-II family nitrogen regulator [Candidatus Cyclobacteriaceae bacterium M3_2C_046]
MKKIEALIRKEKFEQVKDALHQQGLDFFTYHEVFGVGHQEPKKEQYRGTTYLVDAFKRIHITIVVGETKLDSILNIILDKAHTGQVGDGKILISDVEKMIRIRDGKTNEKALDLALI